MPTAKPKPPCVRMGCRVCSGSSAVMMRINLLPDLLRQASNLMLYGDMRTRSLIGLDFVHARATLGESSVPHTSKLAHRIKWRKLDRVYRVYEGAGVGRTSSKIRIRGYYCAQGLIVHCSSGDAHDKVWFGPRGYYRISHLRTGINLVGHAGTNLVGGYYGKLTRYRAFKIAERLVRTGIPWNLVVGKTDIEALSKSRLITDELWSHVKQVVHDANNEANLRAIPGW